MYKYYSADINKLLKTDINLYFVKNINLYIAILSQDAALISCNMYVIKKNIFWNRNNSNGSVNRHFALVTVPTLVPNYSNQVFRSLRDFCKSKNVIIPVRVGMW